MSPSNMDFVALLSGGKDSLFNAMECIAHGYQLKAIAHLSPPEYDHQNGCANEIDSYMYQTVGSEGIEFVSKALSVPLYQIPITAKTICNSLIYTNTDDCQEDEVEHLHNVLYRVKADFPSVQFVSSGAILSNYQRTRVENVVSRLGMKSLAFLWQRDQRSLLNDMIAAAMDVIIVKIAAFGLDVDKDLGSRLIPASPRLLRLSKPPWELNICGEGGEYETFTLDCPLYRQRIVLRAPPFRVLHSEGDPINPTAYLQLTKLGLENKVPEVVCRDAADLLSGKWLPQDGSPSFNSPFISPSERLATLETDVCQEIAKDLQVGCSCFEFLADSGSQDHYDSPHLWLTPSQVATEEVLINEGCQNYREAARRATESVIVQLQNLLHSKGLNSLHVLHCLLLVDQPITDDLYHAVNSAYMNEFGLDLERTDKTSNNRILPPSRVCVGVELGRLSTGNEISASKQKPMVSVSLSALVHSRLQLTQDFYEQTTTTTEAAEWVSGLHVRSISHWAPANIGPYSQVISLGKSQACGDTVSGLLQRGYLAGQIGLVPETMSLPPPPGAGGDEGTWVTQTWLALRHCHRVMKTISKATWRHLSVGVCYGTSLLALATARRQFHQSVCRPLGGQPNLSALSCLRCAQRLAWVLVTSLPRRADTEWHLVVETCCPSSTASRIHFLPVGDVVPVLSRWSGSGRTSLVLYRPDQLMLLSLGDRRDWLSAVEQVAALLPVRSFLSVDDDSLCITGCPFAAVVIL